MRTPTKEWSFDEDTILFHSYPIDEVGELIAKLPGRTWKAIFSRASRLKIKRGKQFKNPVKSRQKPKTKLLGDMINARLKQNLTQDQVADEVGLNGQNRLANYEAGKGISMFMLVCWCDALNLELRAFPKDKRSPRKSRAKKNNVVLFKPPTMAETAAQDMGRWKVYNDG